MFFNCEGTEKILHGQTFASVECFFLQFCAFY